MREQIESAYGAWNEAFNHGDAQALASLYLQDAKLLPPTHTVIEAQQAIEEFWDGLFRAGMTGHTLELITVRSDQRNVIGAAKWSARGKGRDGTERIFSGSAVHVFERQQDGGLKLWLHAWN